MTTRTDPEPRYVFNGVDALTGTYAWPPGSLGDFARLARSDGLGSHLSEVLQRRRSQLHHERQTVDGADATRVAEAGWGVVFSAKSDSKVRDALLPLLAHRRGQTEFFREYFGPEDGYQPGESKLDFLTRHGAGPGRVDPAVVPYYLMLVGNTDEIPFNIQYQLGIQYAVGRLSFDHLDDYARYAATVLETEREVSTAPRRAVFFGPTHPDDECTRVTRDEFLDPLTRQLSQSTEWKVDKVLDELATKERLGSLLAGRSRPDLLFSASHGLLLPSNNPRQRERQGALVTKEWPGPATLQPVRRNGYFAAEDLDLTSSCRGLVCFFVACFSGGTPRWDALDRRALPQRRRYTERAFVARLPERLLAAPEGCALAVVCHVDLAHLWSFQWNRKPHFKTFEETLCRLLKGQPVGWAMEPFSQRYVELVADLHDLDVQEELSPLAAPDTSRRVNLWAAVHDAQGYVVLGDPSVGLGVSHGSEAGSGHA